MNEDSQICVCSNCESFDQITCVGNEIKDPNEFFPKWLQQSSYYERVVSDERYDNFRQISCSKHYVSLLVHTKDLNGQMISSSDISSGRMGHKILIVDLIKMCEFELIPNQSGHVDQMTRDQICQLWPIQFMIIDQEWALLLATNNDDEDGHWFTLMLLKTSYETKVFTIKDTLTIWDDPYQKVFVTGLKNLVEENDPICSVIMSSSRITDTMQRADSILTIFVSFNRLRQKLYIVERIAGRSLNWFLLIFAALIGRKLYKFEMERVNDDAGDFLIYVVNFNQIKVYDMDKSGEKQPQLMKLIPPAGYEHELGTRASRTPDLIHIAWSYDQCTVCLSARPPFYNITNTFMLDFSTFRWLKVQIPGQETASQFNLRFYYKIISRFCWFSEQTLVVYSDYMRFGKKSKGTKVGRWYRVHVRRPASLFELAFSQTKHLNLSKRCYDFIESLI